MPVYHFNLTDGEPIEDTEGEECRNLDDAKRIADRTALELGKNRDTKQLEGFRISVTDETGREVYSVPLVKTPRPQ